MTIRVYTEDNLTPETWMRNAACATTNPDAWFPKNGDRPTAEAAIAICTTCPVQAECINFAVRTGQTSGIWGGLSPRRLGRLRRRSAA